MHFQGSDDTSTDGGWLDGVRRGWRWKHVAGKCFTRPHAPVREMQAVGEGTLVASAWLRFSLRDLNPLHDVINRRDYKEKYYKSLMPLGLKYAELLPWGGKLTSESLRFFSPIVIWTKFTSSQYKHGVLYSAFMDYYKAWLELMEQAAEERDTSQIICNREAQHRYLTWRAEKMVNGDLLTSETNCCRDLLISKTTTEILFLPTTGLFLDTFADATPENQDPGHRILKKLIGESLSKDLVRSFLFNGVDELGTKTFLDYFPEYCCENGTINDKRSIIGKSFESRPWDTSGEFIGNHLKNYNLALAFNLLPLYYCFLHLPLLFPVLRSLPSLNEERGLS
ncbi:Phytochromobilin:ferredoxin oxidoreductase, chloroplastic [Vitis vinifera]|uniref:Phytochromobilin:ferredoxin oxidoreductase, chloroplastic n=1 Tax=Vitis vinifera TaxID=29760 RepID=A0A438KFS4_VITVI|nr:Phytochromobilin:ferredoxin oxidoreductase, chloroplastic [Vitis vinifera]